MAVSGKKIKRFLWGSVVVLGILALGLGTVIYREVFFKNVNTGSESSQYLLIATGSTFDDVMKDLKENRLIKDEKSFRWTALQMKYDKNIRPGRYELKAGMTNKDLIALLRSGRQTPVKLVINNIRTKGELADRVSKQIEADRKSLLAIMNDSVFLSTLGFTRDNILVMFLPDTYEMYWNTTASQFLKRMKKEYDRFWTASRLKQAAVKNLTPQEVSILASIVQQETNRDDEKPDIAGVYLNRLKKGWKLEADPTLVWALGDFSIGRVLNVYKKIDSPYNTYKYAGLPPGPICLPTQASLNAVLNASSHSYMYFCAKEDFSGYHRFSSTYEQHLLNAKRFQNALNKRGIRS